jgi:hypothetical protein
MTFRSIVCVLPVLIGLGGCAEGTTTVGVPRERAIRDVDPDRVLTEAAVILQREFGRVHVDRAARRIMTVPVEYTTERESGTARDLVRGRSVMRRTANFNVGQRGGAAIARLQIDIERKDTERQTVMQPRGHRLGDTPGEETPIDRDAATSERQNTVWTQVRRDTKLETALLAELQDRCARLTADSEPAQTGAPGPPGAEPASDRPRATTTQPGR